MTLSAQCSFRRSPLESDLSRHRIDESCSVELDINVYPSLFLSADSIAWRGLRFLYSDVSKGLSFEEAQFYCDFDGAGWTCSAGASAGVEGLSS